MIHDRILLSLALTITKDCVVESVALEINAFLGETSPKNSSPDERGIPEIANAENVAARKSPAAAAAATITPCERPETILLRRCCFGNGDSAVTGHTQPLSRRGREREIPAGRGERREVRYTRRSLSSPARSDYSWEGERTDENAKRQFAERCSSLLPCQQSLNSSGS